jgi:hypothetical protein
MKSFVKSLFCGIILVSAFTSFAIARQDDGSAANLITNGPGVFRFVIKEIKTVPGPPISFYMPPTNLPPELRRALVSFLVAGNVVQATNMARALDHYLPGSFNQYVWTNFISITNGRSMLIWSVRDHPAGWPAQAPSIKWNPKSLIWGLKGFTALSPCWESEGNPGQVPITALTRRHGYTRGHSMGSDRFGNLLKGKKVWFLTARDRVVQVTVLREVVRTFETSGRDYSILLFGSDLPDDIQPMRVCDYSEILGATKRKYMLFQDAPCPLFETEQTGNVSAEVPGFTCNTWKGGDSGSPNMVLSGRELLFLNGRSTAPASPEMQKDMDDLCRAEGLRPEKYQLQWAKFTEFPSY